MSKQSYEIAKEELQKLFLSLGITAEISAPIGKVKENNWPCISYQITFTRGNVRHVTEYNLGLGHVDIAKARPGSIFPGWTADETAMLNAWKASPHANFKNKVLQAQVAAKLAKAQKVAPIPAEVLACLCADAISATESTFENWAAEYGYDADSRKAEGIYNACRAPYPTLLLLCGVETVRKLAELHSQL